VSEGSVAAVSRNDERGHTSPSDVHAAGLRARVPPVPDDVDRGAKADGIVVLPPSIRWSGPSPTYDLSRRADRIRVYEEVLRDGTADDIRRFVDVDELIRLWPDLVLPQAVRSQWRAWVRQHRDVDLVC
jgi:hypothetical protein